MSTIEIVRISLKYLSVFLNYLGKATVIMYCYWSVYLMIGMFTTRKFPKAKKKHRYAVMIAARNEQPVIGNLIDSIKGQDYPSDLVTVFVVADNCTDKTAEIARQHGAVCYERFDDAHRTKGFALEFLVDCIDKDYGIPHFDGYFIFDADNLLKKDYISRMNEAFDSGEKIITSFRNTKNFDENWISASYGIHWLRTVRAEHRARSVLHLATRIQGTGFLFANEIIKNGWHYVSFTEDRALSADSVVNGYEISYCDAAEFYDEQPTSLKIALRQRIRWGKGHLQAFVESGGKLLKNIFAKKSFMSYDMFLVIFPNSAIAVMRRWLNLLAKIALSFLAANALKGTLGAFWAYFVAFGSRYFKNMLMGIYVFFIERKRIKKIKLWKKAYFCLMWPLFDIIGAIAVIIALFSHVEWKPIPHESKVTIDDISLDMKH